MMQCPNLASNAGKPYCGCLFLWQTEAPSRKKAMSPESQVSHWSWHGGNSSERANEASFSKASANKDACQQRNCFCDERNCRMLLTLKAIEPPGEHSSSHSQTPSRWHCVVSTRLHLVLRGTAFATRARNQTQSEVRPSPVSPDPFTRHHIFPHLPLLRNEGRCYADRRQFILQLAEKAQSSSNLDSFSLRFVAQPNGQPRPAALLQLSTT